MDFLKQNGVISPLILLSIIGVVAILLLSSVLSSKGNLTYKSKLFPKLYPKRQSYAFSDPTGAVFSLRTNATNIDVGQEIPVTILVRTDTHKANLFSAQINFDKDKLEVLRIERTDTFITQWIETIFNNNTGRISVIGGFPKPGFTTSGSDALMATVVFRTKVDGQALISFDTSSKIYKNSDNANFLTRTNDLTIGILPSATPTPTPAPTPTPTPTPAPTACTLIGARWTASNNPAVEGSIVTLQVISEGNCLSETVSFEVREDDGLLGFDPILNQPSNATFNTNGSLSTSWVAEYQPDGFGGLNDPPEYYFNATLLSDNTTITSILPNLEVTKLPATGYKKGDINRDTVVDLQDLSIMFSYWFDTTNFPDEADINSDGIINTFDFSSMLVILSNEGVIGAL